MSHPKAVVGASHPGKKYEVKSEPWEGPGQGAIFGFCRYLRVVVCRGMAEGGTDVKPIGDLSEFSR